MYHPFVLFWSLKGHARQNNDVPCFSVNQDSSKQHKRLDKLVRVKHYGCALSIFTDVHETAKKINFFTQVFFSSLLWTLGHLTAEVV